MQIWRPKARFDIRSAPDLEARTDRIAEDDTVTRIVVLGPHMGGPDEPWVKVRVFAPDAKHEGFAKFDWLVAVPIAEDIDLKTFASACLDAALVAGTSVHYLIALAHVESGIRNKLSNGSSAFGPFQFLENTWNDYIAAGETGYSEIDIVDPYAQPAVAARIAVEGAQMLLGVLGRRPNFAELYFTHLFGRRGGQTILAGEIGRPIDVALMQVYADQGRVKRILDKNSGLLMRDDEPRTVAEVLDEVGRRFDEGLRRAAELIRQILDELPPEAESEFVGDPPPLAAAGDDAAVPWMARAKEELGVTEVAGESRSNPRVEQYFRSTTLGTQKDHFAWCAAFVSWCIDHCEAPKVVRQNINSARAADWRGFGVPVPEPRYGAVIVLKPKVPGTSGHVGFAVSWTDTKVTLLGGNQGEPDSVCKVTFPRSDIRQNGIRVPAAH